MSEQLDLFGGRHERDEALGRLEVHRKDYLQRARLAIAEYLYEGASYVTADDVHRLCPPDDSYDPRVIGAVLGCEWFLKAGQTHTKRKQAHARPIARFVLSAKGRRWVEAMHR